MQTKLIITNDIHQQVALLQQEHPSSHPDNHYITHDSSIKIADIRQAKAFTTQKPISATFTLICFFPADILTSAAQNAMLKMLEEPPEFVQCILIASSRKSLLPTILSRCQISIIQHQTTSPTFDQTHIHTFITQPFAAKLDYIAGIKNRVDALDLTSQLLQYAHHAIHTPNPPHPQLIKHILIAHRRIAANANPQLCLEVLSMQPHWQSFIEPVS